MNYRLGFLRRTVSSYLQGKSNVLQGTQTGLVPSHFTFFFLHMLHAFAYGVEMVGLTTGI